MEFLHTSLALILSLRMNSCLAADLLLGKIFLSRAGSLCDGLDPSLAAFLASSSALSFPTIPHALVSILSKYPPLYVYCLAPIPSGGISPRYNGQGTVLSHVLH